MSEPTYAHTTSPRGVRTVGLLSIIAGIVLVVAGPPRGGSSPTS